MKKTLLPALLFCIISGSCKKNNNSNPDGPVVYLAGYQWDSVAGNDRSTVWKNGTALTNQMSGITNHYAYGIYVNGSDVYTTGFENQPSQWKCMVWKNSILQYTLGTGYSYGNGIAVTGSDVLVTGGAYTQSPLTYSAMLWKNQSGPATTLASNGGSTLGTAIVLSGTDTYVAGYENNIGRIWKNGTSITLNNAAGFPISCVAVSGNNVYGAASNGNIIRYWINENHTDINIPIGSSGVVTGIAIDGNDVYLSGWEYNGTVGIAKYWKNGNSVGLGDGIRSSRAKAIAIHTKDMYVAGEVRGTGTVYDLTTLWRNENPGAIAQKDSRSMATADK